MTKITYTKKSPAVKAAEKLEKSKPRVEPITGPRNFGLKPRNKGAAIKARIYNKIK